MPRMVPSLIIRALYDNWDLALSLAYRLGNDQSFTYVNPIRGEFRIRRTKSGAITVVQTKTGNGRAL